LLLIHTLLHEDPIRVSPAAHQNWQDRLAFYGNGLFARGQGSDSSFGCWDEAENGMVILNWCGWAAEVFIPMRDDCGEFTGSGLVVSRQAADHLYATASGVSSSPALMDPV
jgi:hypothetical protein